ncbi:YfbU family protein [Sutcliffiella sp. NC1]|uniref:YfbU family protein n=1 Tax=Sutcliffiella sp. NC1 TaxID=3004096 RepID=UPI0022DE2E47|nr:YfbU family protein [Sutcliffiella sp. NC1]WBL16438.1 YfbU family protein [Sutcliffiella sp. NC1]
MSVEFSLKERLILMNQYDIMAKLTSDEYEKKSFENYSEIFRCGYEWGYGLVTEPLLEELSGQECKFVCNVLDMYSDLYYAREKDENIKAEVDAKDVIFKGFDLNDSVESKYYGFAKFLIEDLGRYREYRELLESGVIESLNSHGFGPSARKLVEMVEVYKKVKKRSRDRHDYNLNMEEVLEVLSVK